MALLARIAGIGSVAVVVAYQFQMEDTLTLNPVRANTQSRAAIGGPIGPELLAQVVRETHSPVKEAYRSLVRLSLDTRLLPVVAVTAAVHNAEARADLHPDDDAYDDRCTLPLLSWMLQDSGFSSRIEAGNDAITRHFDWISQQGKRAADHLAQANLRLVVSVARKYIGRGMSLLDMVKKGCLGLPRGVEKFDHRRLQVQHLRHMVDSSGGDPGHSRSGPNHPCAGPHGGDHQLHDARGVAAGAAVGSRLRGLREPRFLFDGRNALDPVVMEQLGFEYRGVGRNAPADCRWQTERRPVRSANAWANPARRLRIGRRNR